MKSTSICVAVVLGASLASAQVGINCDGSHFPNYDDCDKIVDYFGFRDDPSVVAYNGQDRPEPSCTFWFWDDGNCRISTCWTVTNQYAHDNDGPERLEDSGRNIAANYDGIKAKCESLRGGGTWPAVETLDGKSWSYHQVWNDPDQSPPDSAVMRRHDPEVFHKEVVSLEEHEKWVRRTQAKLMSRKAEAESEERTKPKAGDLWIEPRTAIMAAKRDDDDDAYEIQNSGINLRKPDTYDTGPRGNNGISTEYSTTESKTFTSSVSTSIGAAFKMFTASIDFGYEESDEFSITQGLTFTPNCDGNQQGQAFFYPFYDWYDVTFLPSGDRAEIWLPVPESKKFVKGEIVVECLG